ncbi:Serine/threonine-protein kinase VRK1 [Aphelenchoides fujianensis]|nr:Serine/threonine-protein kinase VRK1 [Aphelenchoides fujianensis]
MLSAAGDVERDEGYDTPPGNRNKRPRPTQQDVKPAIAAKRSRPPAQTPVRTLQPKAEPADSEDSEDDGISSEFEVPEERVAPNPPQCPNAPRSPIVLDGGGRKYKLLREIGKGAYSRVWLASVSNGDQKFAVKFGPSSGTDFLYPEAKIAQSLLFKHVDAYKRKKGLNFLGLTHFIHPNREQKIDGRMMRFLVMPLYGRSLQEFIDSRSQRSLSLREIGRLLPAVLNALEALHSFNCVHGDLKASDLLFPVGRPFDLEQITLVDFNLGLRYGSFTGPTKTQNPASAHDGTPYFASCDSHRGQKPCFRGDVEILGHNVFAWLQTVDRLPWKDAADQRDYGRVQALKMTYVDNQMGLLEAALYDEAALLLSTLYRTATTTDYEQKVDFRQLKELRFTSPEFLRFTATRRTQQTPASQPPVAEIAEPRADARPAEERAEVAAEIAEPPAAVEGPAPADPTALVQQAIGAAAESLTAAIGNLQQFVEATHAAVVDRAEAAAFRSQFAALPPAEQQRVRAQIGQQLVALQCAREAVRMAERLQ